ncbi:hypothetical protein F5Y19DRAFT_480382 [Xylariaceae sp. FL1651]|nr:hypothetical protein F5Y19DRAFT_480382 [Xylariaceae sp. FL1651]
MYRATLVSLALVALVHAAPITEPTKTVKERQITLGNPTTGETIPDPTFIILPPITGGLNPSTKRATKTVEERQFSWGDPSTGWGSGGGQPSAPSASSTILPPITGGLNPSTKKRQVLGGSGPDPTQAKIISLELEYETLLQAFGSVAAAPKPIQNRMKDIKSELLKYGITIVQSPDGTITTFVPGKRDVLPDGVIPGGPLVPAKPIPGGPIVPSN